MAEEQLLNKCLFCRLCLRGSCQTRWLANLAKASIERRLSHLLGPTASPAS